MTELSLNVLDVAQNSIKAGATLIEISVDVQTVSDRITIVIADNGCGMDEATLSQVTDPFYTTRTTRKVGLGVPLFKMAAEMTGGSFEITSQVGKGTRVTAEFVLSDIDRMPLGDMPQTVEMLIVYNTAVDFIYTYRVDEDQFELSTAQMREILDGVPLDNPEVVTYIRDFLKENTLALNKNQIF